MNFTPEEISLCKQVVEKHIKDIFYGDWFLQYDDFGNEVIDISFGISMKLTKEFKLIPLWTISDCLEFLNQHDSHCILLGWTGKTKRSKKYCHVYILNRIYEGEGYTYLEACLKAVLAVLKEDE